MLYVALHQRCLKYFLPIEKNPIKTGIQCEQEAKSFLINLNLKVALVEDPRDGFVGPSTVAFHKELEAMMTQKEAYFWLSEIETQLQLSHVLKFDLYKASLKVLKSSSKATQYIAILLQDTSPSVTQLFYLKRHVQVESKIFKANIEKLESVVKQFARLQSTQEWKKNYFLYPDYIESLNSKLASTQYHYYVLAWNSHKMLAADRPRSTAKIVFINTMFNFLYERFHKLNSADLLSDFRAIDPKSAADVRLGFFGALGATGIHPQSIQLSNELPTRPDLFFKTISQQLVQYFPN